MLPRKYRLPAKDFQYLYHKGFKIRGKYGMLISKENSISFPLFGFVVSKKIGDAVRRHRMTRLLRVISMQLVKELSLENVGRSFQYIAFEFCDDFNLLKDEFQSQMKESLKNEKTFTSDN